MTNALAPLARQKYFDNNGRPLARGRLFTYANGTTTKQATAKNKAGTANMNPIVLDARGECDLWLPAAEVFTLTLAPPGVDDPPTSTIWTENDVQAALVEPVDSSVVEYAIIAAESGVTVIDKQYLVGDIRRYGADTAASNNYAAIQAALDVSAAGGPAAYIPYGTWQYTQTPTRAASASIIGCGATSILQPTGCNGLELTGKSQYGVAVEMAAFAIVGSGTGSCKGIYCNLPSTSGQLVDGMNFRSVSIQNFGTAVYTSGLWNSVFDGCNLYNNYVGFNFIERNIDIKIENTRIERGTISGSGSPTGISMNQSGGIRSESIKINGSFIYGYDIGVNIGNVLFAAITHCDIDNTQLYCVQIVTGNGGITVRDSWLDTTANAATMAVNITDLAGANNDHITIADNEMTCSTANVGSVGVFVGNLQKAVQVTGNKIAGFNVGVKNNAADNNRIKGNTIDAVATAVLVDSSSVNVEVGPNTVIAGTPLVFSGATTPTGFQYYATGTFTLTLTGVASGGTGTVTWVANGRSVALTTPSAGILGVSNTTAMTGTGLPAVLWPVTTRFAMIRVQDNSVNGVGMVSITNGGVVTFQKDVTGAIFTAANNKGVADQIRYEYV